MSEPRLGFLADNGEAFAKQLALAGQAMNKEIAKLLRGVATEGEIVLLNDANMELLAALHGEYTALLERTGFNSVVREYLAETPDLIKQAVRVTDTSGFPTGLARTDLAGLDALQNMDIKQMNSRIAGAEEVIRQQLMNSMQAGVEWDDMYTAVADALDKNLVQYAGTYMETARAGLAQKIEDIGAEKTRESGDTLYWEYVGPLDTKTRDECVLGLEQAMFTDAERAEFEAAYGDAFGRWNCRHAFQQVTAEDHSDNPGNGGPLREHEGLKAEQKRIKAEKLSEIDADRKKFLDKELRAVNSQMRNIAAPIRPQPV